MRGPLATPPPSSTTDQMAPQPAMSPYSSNTPVWSRKSPMSIAAWLRIGAARRVIGRCETETTGRLRAVGRETPSIRNTRTPPRWFSSLDDTRHTAIDDPEILRGHRVLDSRWVDVGHDASIQHGIAIAHVYQISKPMRRDQHGCAHRTLHPDPLGQPAGTIRVETVPGLIQHDQIGPGLRQSNAKADQLALPARQRTQPSAISA